MFAERSLLRARGCEQVRCFGGGTARSKKQEARSRASNMNTCTELSTHRSAILSEPETGRASASENICIPVTSGWLLTFGVVGGEQQKSYLNTSFMKYSMLVAIFLCLCLDFQRVSKFPKDFDEPGDFRLGKIRILLDLNRLAQSGEWRRPVSLRSCVSGVNRAGRKLPRNTYFPLPWCHT